MRGRKKKKKSSLRGQAFWGEELLVCNTMNVGGEKKQTNRR